MNEKLKPCPLCGGDAKVVSYYIKGVANRLNYFVQCEENKCHRTRSRRKRVNAIADWENEIFDRQHEEWIRRKQVSVPTEEVYNVYYDTAGNCHFTGTKSGEHIIPANTKAVTDRERIANERAFDRCIIIRDTLLSGSGITLQPTLENIEFITMCAEALEKEGEKR